MDLTLLNDCTLQYVTLQAINYSLKGAVSLKNVTQSVYVTENYILKYSTRINCTTICIHIGCI